MPFRMGFCKVSPGAAAPRRGEGRGDVRSQEGAAAVLGSDRVCVAWGGCGFVLHQHSLALSLKAAGGLRWTWLIWLMPFAV